jgi:hypothetical protein
VTLRNHERTNLYTTRFGDMQLIDEGELLTLGCTPPAISLPRGGEATTTEGAGFSSNPSTTTWISTGSPA